MEINTVGMCWDGSIGIVVGFEDYSGSELVETTKKPDHNEWRVIVETSTDDRVYLNKHHFRILGD